MIVSLARSAEVGLGALYSSNINLVNKVLKLAEVEGGTMLGIESTNLIVSITRSTKVGLGSINSGNVNRIHKFHQI